MTSGRTLPKREKRLRFIYGEFGHSYKDSRKPNSDKTKSVVVSLIDTQTSTIAEYHH